MCNPRLDFSQVTKRVWCGVCGRRREGAGEEGGGADDLERTRVCPAAHLRAADSTDNRG